MMHWLGEHLAELIKAVAVVQMIVAILNLNLIRFLRWREDLARAPLLLRQVIQVHLWFISLTLAIFAVLSWRFATGMANASDETATWLSGGIGMFWGIRAILQMIYYSGEHWRGRVGPTVVHVVLLLLYVSMSCVYFVACAGGGP